MGTKGRGLGRINQISKIGDVLEGAGDKHKTGRRIGRMGWGRSCAFAWGDQARRDQDSPPATPPQGGYCRVKGRKMPQFLRGFNTIRD